VFTKTAIVFVFLLFGSIGFGQANNAIADRTAKVEFAGGAVPHLSPSQREEMHSVVREYLLANPAIVREALQALAAREEQARVRKQSEAILARASALTEDTQSPSYGSAKADVTIVEFLDYRCTYCKRISPILTALVDRDPNVRIVFKELPILGPDSLFAARAALVAHRRGKYMAFHKELMAAPELTPTAVAEIATRIGIGDGFLAAVEDPAITDLIQRNSVLANDLEIGGTPALVIGDRLIPGASDVETLAMYVAAERARSRGAKGNLAAAQQELSPGRN